MNQQQAGDGERDDSLWVVVLKAEGEGPPTGRRIARLLKSAGRAHGLKCIAYGGAELLAGEQLQEQAAAPAGLPDGGEGLYDSTTERGG